MRTDTSRITDIPGEVWPDTSAIPTVRLLPPIPAADRRPVESRLARRARIFRASPFARRLTATGRGLWTATRWTAAGAVGLVVVVAFFLGTRELAEFSLRSTGVLP